MIELDEHAVRERLRPLTHDARFQRAIANVTGDRLFLSLFLMGVSHGEGLGEAGVAAIGQEEIAHLVGEVRPRRSEEIDRAEEIRRSVSELFPEYFEHGQYRYDDYLFGREHHLTVREANRRSLRERGRYSALNLYLTTTFGYEIMTALLYGTVIEGLGRGPLPREITERVALLLRSGAPQPGIVALHNALVAADRGRLPPAAHEALDQLGRLTADDYERAAEQAVSEVVAAYLPYADAAALRARLPGA